MNKFKKTILMGAAFMALDYIQTQGFAAEFKEAEETNLITGSLNVESIAAKMQPIMQLLGEAKNHAARYAANDEVESLLKEINAIENPNEKMGAEHRLLDFTRNIQDEEIKNKIVDIMLNKSKRNDYYTLIISIINNECNLIIGKINYIRSNSLERAAGAGKLEIVIQLLDLGTPIDGVGNKLMKDKVVSPIAEASY